MKEMSQDVISSRPSITTIALISPLAITVAYLYFSNMRKKQKSKNDAPGVTEDGRRLSRRISFTSASMAMGAFPESSSMSRCQPIINGVLIYGPGDLPSQEEFSKAALKVLLFDRCAGIPVGTIGKNDWRFRECRGVREEPQRMVRTIGFSGGEDALFEIVGEHMQDDLREGRGDLPWWELLVLKNEGDGKSAVVFRMEHCLADGLSMVGLFESLLTYSDGTPMTGGFIPTSMGNKFRKKTSGFLSMFFKSLTSTLKVLSLPSSRFDDSVAFRQGMGNGMSFSGNRKALIFNTVSLDFIKALKNAANVTINDIFLTCLSQAIRDYNIQENCDVTETKGDKLQFRALMPVAFPRPSSETSDPSTALRNKWVFVSMKMGVGIKTIMDRLNFVTAESSRLKKSPEAFCQLKVQESIPPKLPLKLARQTVYDMFVRHSLVFANVPGPAKPCSFAGHEVIEVQILFNNLIPQVEILSYRGKVFMNFVVDPKTLPNSDSIPILFSQALVSLAKELKVDVPLNVIEHSKKILPC